MGIRSSVRRRPRAGAAAGTGAVAVGGFVVVWFEPQLFLGSCTSARGTPATTGTGGTRARISTWAPCRATWGPELPAARGRRPFELRQRGHLVPAVQSGVRGGAARSEPGV